MAPWLHKHGDRYHRDSTGDTSQESVHRMPSLASQWSDLRQEGVRRSLLHQSGGIVDPDRPCGAVCTTGRLIRGLVWPVRIRYTCDRFFRATLGALSFDEGEID